MKEVQDKITLLRTMYEKKDRVLSRAHVFEPEAIRASRELEWLKDKDGRMFALSAGYSQHLGVDARFYEGKFDYEIHGGGDGDRFLEVDEIMRKHQTAVILEESWTNGAGSKERGLVLKIATRVAGGIGTYGYIFRHTIVSDHERRG